MACVFDGIAYKNGESWLSEENCSNNTCYIKHDGVTINTEYICGKVQHCNPRSIAEHGTKGIFNITLSPDHVNCVNQKTIRGLTECHGSCASSYFMNYSKYYN